MGMRSDITAEEQELASAAYLRGLNGDHRPQGSPEPRPGVPPLARLLWDCRAFVLRWAGRGCLIALVMALLVPNRYTSTTRLMPPDGQAGSGMAMLVALTGKTAPGLSGLASDVLGGKTTGALFVDALRSRTVEDRLVNRFDLRRVYGTGYMQDARASLENNTGIAEDRKSGVITIAVSDRDRVRAAQLAQAYVDELNQVMNDVSTSSARRERIFIEQRLASVKQDLHRAAEDFSQFASHNTTLDLTAQTKATVEAAATLQGELIAAQSQLEGLEQMYTDNNVRVRSLRARVDELKLKLQEISGQETSADSAPASDMPFPSIRKLPLLGVRWAELYQETKVQETVYELLTQQYELAKIQEAREVPTVKILDAAVISERKSFPPRLTFVLLGTAIGFITGAAWVYGTASWRAMEPDDPMKSFALEVVGVQKAWLRKKGRGLTALLGKEKDRTQGGEERGRETTSGSRASGANAGP